MIKVSITRTIFIIFFIVFIVFPTTTHAYLDPGSGSYLFQILIAGFMGFAFTIKVFWKRIKDFFINLSKKNKS